MSFYIKWHDRLDSTNHYLKKLIYKGDIVRSKTIIVAHNQTKGVGRLDRSWISPAYTNLCFSFFYAVDVPIPAIPSFTMAMSLAINDYLRSFRMNSQPKWPNDVLVNNKKIAGILSEHIDSSENSIRGIITGIGININMTKDQIKEIDKPATSILIEKGKISSIKETLEALIPHLEYWINEWEKNHFESIRTIWETLTGPIGKELEVHDGKDKIKGKLYGYGKHGELLIDQEGMVRTIWSGEIP